jgi:RNA polymerase sigma factor (sigma-70 family)
MSDDVVQHWLNQAGRYPLLPASREIHYATLVRSWLDSDTPTLQQIRAGQKAKERLMLHNLRLAVNRAKKFRARGARVGLALEDLIGESMIGLNRAAEKFDPARGYKFSTYCVLWLDQAIRRLITVSDTIRVPVNVGDVLRKWEYKPVGMTTEEFCEANNITPEKLKLDLAHYERLRVCSLNTVINSSQNDLSEIGELLPDERSTLSLDHVDWEDAIEAIRSSCPDELALFELEAGGAKPGDLADMLGIEKHQVRKHLRAASETVKQHCPSHIKQELIATVQESPRRLSVAVLEQEPHSSNGHPSLRVLEQCLEAPAAEPVAAPVAAPMADPEAQAEPKRRGRPSKASMAADVLAELQGSKPRLQRRPRQPQADSAPITPADASDQLQVALPTVLGIANISASPEHMARLLRALGNAA